MSTYRHKTDEPYAEFIIRDRGISDHPSLTIEVESTYDEDFIAELKIKLRHGLERAWEPELKRWFISPLALERACAIAGKHFSHVYLIEGDKTTDVVTGQSWEQEGLFK